MLLGGYLASENPAGLDEDDAVISAAGAAITLWQTLGWGEVLEADGRLFGGVGGGLNALLPSLVGGGLAIASPQIDISQGHSLSAISLGLWGTYTGAVVGYLNEDRSVTVRAGDDDDWDEPDERDRNIVLRSSLIGSDLGLIGGVMLMSPLVGLDPVIVGVANAGGVVGASVAALATSFVTDEGDPILLGSLVGAGAGGVGGYVLGTRYADRIKKREGRVRGNRLSGLASNWQLSPTSFVDEDSGVMYGALLSHRGW